MDKTSVLKANSRTAEPQRLPDSDFYLSMNPIFLGYDLRQWILQTKHKVKIHVQTEWWPNMYIQA